MLSLNALEKKATLPLLASGDYQQSAELLGAVVWMFVSLLNLCVEILKHNVMVLGDGAFGNQCPYRRRPREHSCSFHHVRLRQAVWDPEGGPHLLMLAPGSWASSLQHCEKWISVACKPPSLWCFIRATRMDSNTWSVDTSLQPLPLFLCGPLPSGLCLCV